MVKKFAIVLLLSGACGLSAMHEITEPVYRPKNEPTGLNDTGETDQQKEQQAEQLRLEHEQALRLNEGHPTDGQGAPNAQVQKPPPVDEYEQNVSGLPVDAVVYEPPVDEVEAAAIREVGRSSTNLAEHAKARLELNSSSKNTFDSEIRNATSSVKTEISSKVLQPKILKLLNASPEDHAQVEELIGEAKKLSDAIDAGFPKKSGLFGGRSKADKDAVRKNVEELENVKKKINEIISRLEEENRQREYITEKVSNFDEDTSVYDLKAFRNTHEKELTDGQKAKLDTLIESSDRKSEQQAKAAKEAAAKIQKAIEEEAAGN